MRVGRASAALSPPSKSAAGMAGVLREIREMTPAYLKRVEESTLDYHAAKEVADERAKEVDAAQAALTRSEAAHAEKVRADAEALEERTGALSHREGRCAVRETALDDREQAVAAREKAVATGEGTIARIRDQLEGVGS